MSSGGKGGNGGMRAAEERKGQDVHREEQGEQTATSPLGVSSGQMQHLARLQGLASSVQVGIQPPSPSHVVNSLHNRMRALKVKQPRKQSRHIQKTGSKTRKSRELQEMYDECHYMRNDLANVGMRPFLLPAKSL